VIRVRTAHGLITPRRRALRGGARLTLAVVAGAALALPSAALAQGGSANPFTPGVPQRAVTTPTTTAPTVASTTTTAGSSGLSGGSALAIGIGALVVLGAISLFIWRDARRRAPVRHRAAAATAGAGARSGSKQRPKPRKLSPAERRRRKRGRAR
jgi:hypothetical protein